MVHGRLPMACCPSARPLAHRPARPAHYLGHTAIVLQAGRKGLQPAQRHTLLRSLFVPHGSGLECRCRKLVNLPAAGGSAEGSTVAAAGCNGPPSDPPPPSISGPPLAHIYISMPVQHHARPQKPGAGLGFRQGSPHSQQMEHTPPAGKGSVGCALATRHGRPLPARPHSLTGLVCGPAGARRRAAAPK